MFVLNLIMHKWWNNVIFIDFFAGTASTSHEPVNEIQAEIDTCIGNGE